MLKRDYLIIGAGVAAAHACQMIRKLDKKGSVLMVGNELYLPYDRQPLSREFLTAKNPDIEALYVNPPSWYERNKVEVRLGTIATQLNVERRLAVLDTGQTIEFKKALLATGSRPLRPMVAGATLGNIIYLSTIRDALALRETLSPGDQVVVIGGGQVALEASSTLVMAGYKVKLMCPEQYLWQKWVDIDTAKWLNEVFESAGVELMMNETINGFEGKTVLKNIQTKSGQRFPATLALVALGTDLYLKLVQNTPLSSPNGTPVTSTMETEEKGIFAAGDIALYPDPFFGSVRRAPYFANAVEQGQIAGMNMTGKKRQRYESLPVFSCKVLGMHFDFIGDFSMAPQTIQFEGDREKKKFVAHYYQGDKLMGAVLCNQSPQLLAKVAKEFTRIVRK